MKQEGYKPNGAIIKGIRILSNALDVTTDAHKAKATYENVIRLCRAELLNIKRDREHVG